MINSRKNYVIACARPWCQSLITKLKKKIDAELTLINSAETLTVEILKKINPRYIFFAHWSHNIPEDIHSKYECVIFHMTDLPYGRGGSPLQNLIVQGHNETILSALQCKKELDAGPVYLKERLSLHGSAEEIYIRAANQIESMIITIIKETPMPVEQKGEVVNFKRRTTEQGDWSDAQSLEEVFNRIRMLDAEGYPQAFIRIGEYKLKFSRVSRRTTHLIADVTITKE
jgi:methionyl-tRNA formyltransferase